MCCRQCVIVKAEQKESCYSELFPNNTTSLWIAVNMHDYNYVRALPCIGGCTGRGAGAGGSSVMRTGRGGWTTGATGHVGLGLFTVIDARPSVLGMGWNILNGKNNIE